MRDLIQKQWHLFLFAAIGAACIIAMGKQSGMGVSPDSVFYLEAAKELIQDHALEDFNHLPLVDFPAGYPLLLAFVSWITQSDPLVFSTILNAFLYACLIFFSGRLTQKFFPNKPWLQIAVLGCLVVSPAMIEIYAMLWSETSFLLLLVLFFLVMGKVLSPNNRQHWWVLAAIIAGYAALTRYAGITIIATGCLIVLLQSNWKLGLRNSIRFGLIASLPLAINLIRNKMHTDTFTGLRKPATTGIIDNLGFTFDTIAQWLFLPFSTNTWIVGSILLLLMIAGLWLRRKDAYGKIVYSFALIYAAFMIISASTSKHEQLNSRLLAAILLPVIIVVFDIIYQLHQRKRLSTFIASSFIIAISIFWQYKYYPINWETWDGVKDAGVPGYREQMWGEMEIVQYLRKHKQDFQPADSIYANAHDAVHFLSGIYSRQLPQKEFDWQINRLKNLPCGYIVFIRDADNPELISLDSIRQFKQLQTVVQFEDGALYRFCDSTKL